MSRNARIVAMVLLLHGGVLWAVQSGLVHRVVAPVIPAEILVELAHSEESATPPKALPRTPQTTPAHAAKPAVAVTPQVLTVADPDPTTSEDFSAPAATSTVKAPEARTLATGNTLSKQVSATPALVPPNSDADYLNNTKPVYPPLSKRLREQGKVVVRTLIGADGVARQAEVVNSSGFDRLDQAALATALRWRYVPGKRAGVAEAMWFNLPFSFVLE